MSESDKHGWPYYAPDEIDAVIKVLQSGRVNQWTGTRVRAFEREFAEKIGTNHAVAVANGTLALELALRALQITVGDEVIVTARSFVASASAIVAVGALPVFADIDAASQNITADTIRPLITDNTRALIVVHLAGWPADMPDIMALADRHNLKVIEDCAQSTGARINDRQTGSFGHAAAFSFCQDKIISTGGEGGMMVCSDPVVYDRAWSYKDHGKTLAAVQRARAEATPGFKYVHDRPGSNWRMTEMQAAIGRLQLGKLEDWLTVRRENAGIWREALDGVPGITMPVPPAHLSHAWYKFYAFLAADLPDVAQKRDAMLADLQTAGIRAGSGSCPEIYKERCFAYITPPDYPTARMLGETSLMFEVHPTLDQAQLKQDARRAAEIIQAHLP